MGINFCHIAPVSYLPYVKGYETHLLLAHLIEENADYRQFYLNLKNENPNVFYHVDNSAFEMFKRGQPMYPTEKLLDMASAVKGDSIVMSDYPKENWLKTVDRAQELIPKFKQAGFKTFFCPQSQLGEIDHLIKSFEWAINNADIDYIGVSILNCPIGLGVNEQTFEHTQRDEAFRMQRFLSRWRVLDLLRQHGLLGRKTQRRFHCLGMTDGPNEIAVIRQFHEHIFSWDSSSAIWHGINGIRYDKSPTGLRNGKFEAEVDFSIERSEFVGVIEAIEYNMAVIDAMCED